MVTARYSPVFWPRRMLLFTIYRCLSCRDPRTRYLECNGAIASYAITKSDVTFKDGNGHVTTTKKTIDAAVIRFRGGKSDQFGQGSVRRLRRSGHATLCPVKATWSLWHRDLAPDALLCTLPSGKCLSARSMTAAIKGGASSIGLNPSKFGTHSLRSGGATAMF
uniref:Tyr recombinase domain-containing protein n=1 Tax=Globisporangium ultimum (strain ATCC 200006 / CBS 805.95 / DAOM BR144) TaxID=431595 RepID=K3WVL9_GLOUD